MRKIPFDILPLGARFRYDDPSSNEWVKIDTNRIAEWDASQIDTNWFGQPVRCFTTGDDLSREVLVDEQGIGSCTQCDKLDDIDDRLEKIEKRLND